MPFGFLMNESWMLKKAIELGYCNYTYDPRTYTYREHGDKAFNEMIEIIDASGIIPGLTHTCVWVGEHMTMGFWVIPDEIVTNPYKPENIHNLQAFRCLANIPSWEVLRFWPSSETDPLPPMLEGVRKLPAPYAAMALESSPFYSEH